jgi:hypothetical protein
VTRSLLIETAFGPKIEIRLLITSFHLGIVVEIGNSNGEIGDSMCKSLISKRGEYELGELIPNLFQNDMIGDYGPIRGVGSSKIFDKSVSSY